MFSTTFTRSRLRAFMDAFRQHDTLAPIHSKPADKRVVFGKREKLQLSAISLNRVRLQALHTELTALFEDNGSADLLMLFDSGDASEPRLEIGGTASVTIDSLTGLFAFTERLERTGIVLITSSEELLIDQIISHVTRSEFKHAPQTSDFAARLLVGQTLGAVERKLIVHTLRHCHGNRILCAQMLNIPIQELRSKLRAHFPPRDAESNK